MSTCRSRVILPAALHLRPLRQGQLDGLCGLYALVNAIRLAAHGHGWDDAVHAPALFRSGLAALREIGALDELLCQGMNEAMLMPLGRELLRSAGALLGHEVNRRWIVPSECRRLDSTRALQVICRELRLGHPVVIVLGYRHCTVVVGFTPTRLLLFDSDERSWIDRRACQLEHTRAGLRHRISPASAISIEIGQRT